VLNNWRAHIPAGCHSLPRIAPPNGLAAVSFCRNFQVTENEPDEAFNARLTCDLTPFGLGRAECDANIIFGPFDDPESIEITVPADPEQINRLYASHDLDLKQFFGIPEFRGGIIAAGNTFRGKFAIIKRMQPVFPFDRVRLTCAIEDFEFLEDAKGID